MANVNTFEVHNLGPERVLVCGSFRPQGTGAVVAADTSPQSHAGFSVARTGVGDYLITFDDVWQDMQGCFFSAREAAGAPTYVQGGDYVAASKTLACTIMQESAGTTAATDLADDVDNRVSFMCFFKNTAVGAAST